MGIGVQLHSGIDRPPRPPPRGGCIRCCDGGRFSLLPLPSNFSRTDGSAALCSGRFPNPPSPTVRKPSARMVEMRGLVQQPRRSSSRRVR